MGYFRDWILKARLKIDTLVTFFPILLLLLNLVTKGIFLTSAEISHDEPFSIYHAQFGVATIIDQLKNYNNPPLYEIVLHYWIKLFGISPLSVRLLPYIFACFAPVALFWLAKRNFNDFIAVFSSLFLSFSTLVIYHSHDCRVYTLFLLLSILSMYYFLEIINERAKTAAGVFYILTSALLIYSHYFGFFVLAFQFLHLLLFYRKLLVRFLLQSALIFILYLPHLFILAHRFTDSVSHGTWLQPPAGIESLYNMLWSFSNMPFPTVCSLLILVAALVMILVRHESFINSNAFLITAWFIFPYLGMFFVSYKIPMYIPRYLIFAFPAYYILLCASIYYLGKTSIYRGLLMGALLISFMASADFNPGKKTRVSQAVREIRKAKTPETLVIIWPFDMINSFAYNYNLGHFSEISDNKEYHLMDSLLKAENIFLVNNPNEIPKNFGKYKDVIYFQAGDQKEGNSTGIARYLEEKGTLYRKIELNDTHLLMFFKRK